VKLIITNNNLLTKCYLKVQSDGVEFCAPTVAGKGRWFRFHNIECVLMSPDYLLSFQVGQEVFKIPTDPANPNHQTVIATLVQEVQRAKAQELTV